MELELRKINIKDIQFGGESTGVKNNVLYISTKEVESILKEDERIKEVTVDIARPGESIRIIPVKDVIEPRAKVDGKAFPGIAVEIEEIGEGITYALKIVPLLQLDL